MMIAEGAEFSLNQQLDTAGLVGSVSARVDWGDGQVTDAQGSAAATQGSVKIKFNYDHDGGFFFPVLIRRVERCLSRLLK